MKKIITLVTALLFLTSFLAGCHIDTIEKTTSTTDPNGGMTSTTDPNGGVTFTEGVIYTFVNGIYAAVAGYKGTDAEVVIADTYCGLPVRGILNHAFANKEITSVVLPDSFTFIDGYAFMNCANLTSVVIPPNVKTIGDAAFWDCTSLTSISIPESVTFIGACAFAGCTGIEAINVSENNPYYCSIDGNVYSKDQKTMLAYANGKTATTFTVPDHVTTIFGAFAYCPGLTSVVIPATVTAIQPFSFYDCSDLTDVYYIGTAEEWAEIVVHDYNNALASVTIYYNHGKGSSGVELPDDYPFN